jgi:P2 family phage contractile tail tube protein
MALKDIIRNYTFFIDGVLFTGDVYEVEIPKLRWKVEEYRGGGMDLPVEVKLGHEKLEIGFSISAHSDFVLARYGLVQGEQRIFKFFGELISYDGVQKGVQIEAHGFIRELDQGSVRPGEKTTAKAMVSCDYLKHTIDNKVILEIDAFNLRWIVNGVDKNATSRQLLGLA